MAAAGGWVASGAAGPAASARPSLLRSARRTLALSVVLALAVAMDYLFQPWVWRNWPIDEVLLGWLPILAARGWVALLIAMGGWLALQASWRLPFAARSVLFGMATVAAALAAEVSLQMAGADDAAGESTTLVLRVLRWSTMAMATGGLLLVWRRTLHTDSALRRAEQQRLADDMQLADLRLQALQSQIEPHFLFNTLATARRLGDTDRAQCAHLLGHLHDFVRMGRAAAPGQMRWCLDDELALVRAYLGVIEMRMGGRLRLRYEIAPGTGGCEVPPLALATLVENAVKHGITPAAGGGEIAISSRCIAGLQAGSQALLVLRVADTGVGFGAATAGGGTGIGLANTRARLLNRYGGDAGLELAPASGGGVEATIHMPAVHA
jgi:signal transduction histidine kinase